MKKEWKDFVKMARPWSPNTDPGTGYTLDDNGRVMTPATEEAQLNGTKYEYSPQTDPSLRRAYDFYRDIAPAIRMRELGVKKLPDAEEKAFRDILNVPVFKNQDLGDDLVGLYQPNRLLRYLGVGERIKLAPGADAKTLVHELRHALARRVPLGDVGKLDKLYRFSEGDYAPWWPFYWKNMWDEEMFTTNKEHQFTVYNELYDKLGRPPTADEYFKETRDHLGSWPAMNGYEDMANRSRTGNGNVPCVADFSKSDDYRKAEELIAKHKVPSSFSVGAGDKIQPWFKAMGAVTRRWAEEQAKKPLGTPGRFHFNPADEIRSKANSDYFHRFWNEERKKRLDALQNVSKNIQDSRSDLGFKQNT